MTPQAAPTIVVDERLDVGVHLFVDSEGILTLDYVGVDFVDGDHAVATWSQAEERMNAHGLPLPTAVLVRMRNVRRLTREARLHFSASEQTTRIASRVALLAGNAATRLMANFFMGLNRMPCPIRMFGDEQHARTWLLEGGTDR